MLRKVCIVLLCLGLLIGSASFSGAYEKTVTVSPFGGDFSTVVAAVDSITDASASNRYLIRVFPGIYHGSVVCKSYVDIIGQGINAVVLTHDGTPFVSSLGTPTLVVSSHQSVANMTVRSTAVDGTAILGRYDATESLLENVYVEADGLAIWVGGINDVGFDRESNIDRWMTMRDCTFRSNRRVAIMYDSTLAENCKFIVNTGNITDWTYAVELAGDSIIRDSFINITLSGVQNGEYGAIFHSDNSEPARVERTSVSVRALNPNSTGLIYGIKNGLLAEPLSGCIDIDHCIIHVVNNGSGATYDIIDGYNDPGSGQLSTRVFATKYNADRTFGDITVVSQGDQIVRNLEVTGNLIVGASATLILPQKDRTRTFPLFVTGPTVGFRKLLGDWQASPPVGYSFPDQITLMTGTIIFTSPGTAWDSGANPEGQLLIYKNDNQVDGIDLMNTTNGTATLSVTWPVSISFTPQDKLSMVLEGISEVSDVSIILEYAVD